MPSGKVKVEWKRQGEELTLNITVPNGVWGEIKLPKGYKFEDGSVNCKLASGEYKVLTI